MDEFYKIRETQLPNLMPIKVLNWAKIRNCANYTKQIGKLAEKREKILVYLDRRGILTEVKCCVIISLTLN